MEKNKKKDNSYKHKWSDLSFKDKLSYLLAIACFALGWIITFIAFFIDPIGVIAECILWVLGQSLLYSGCIIGIGQYYNAQTQNFKYEVKKLINTKIAKEDTEEIDES